MCRKRKVHKIHLMKNERMQVNKRGTESDYKMDNKR